MRAWVAVLGAVGMVLATLGVGAAVMFANDAPAPPPSAPPQAAATEPKMPTPEEFTITVTVTEQNCAPDGACLYTYSMTPNYVGFHRLPPEPFTVHYEVAGGHEPQVGEFTVHNGEAMIPQGVTVAGPPHAQLHGSITKVTPAQP